MARKICQKLILVGLVSLILAEAVAVALFQRAFAAQTDETLGRLTVAVAAGYQAEASPDPVTLSAFADDPALRITLIAADGTVLFDSTGKTITENHLSRPEVQRALTAGSGTAVRKSATLGAVTHYCATRLSDGTVLRVADESSDLWQTFNNALPYLLLAGLAVAGLAVLLAWRLTVRLVRPISHLAEHLDTIAADVPYTELEPLARTVQSDRKLREDNEAMRREFTANVSHELKTPLTSISGYAELIENGMAKPEDIPGFAARIHKEASRMIALVSDILQLSELDGMHAVHSDAVEMSAVDLAALVHETANAMQMNARKAYVTLQYDAAAATVRGSRDQLTELITNLCDNAIRYNRPGGHVSVRCGTGLDGCAWLVVEDNGIGIPREAQNRVFERFYRVDKSRSKATGGTGLGLAIVKHIALLHDARIDLKSQVGTGTAVTVNFPRA
jgi:two-component system phosphate regulon sensor histidine kinase PhoR